MLSMCHMPEYRIRDSLLRRLIITRRQAYRQAVYDQAQKVMQANRTGKR